MMSLDAEDMKPLIRFVMLASRRKCFPENQETHVNKSLLKGKHFKVNVEIKINAIGTASFDFLVSLNSFKI